MSYAARVAGAVVRVAGAVMRVAANDIGSSPSDVVRRQGGGGSATGKHHPTARVEA